MKLRKTAWGSTWAFGKRGRSWRSVGAGYILHVRYCGCGPHLLGGEAADIGAEHDRVGGLAAEVLHLGSAARGGERE